MNEKSNITVILPIHEISEKLGEYFTIAVNSIKTQIKSVDELIIVIKPDDDVKKFIASFDYEGLPYRVVENGGETDFASQINLGVKEAKTEWVSFIEIDDQFSTIWIKNAIDYINAYKDVDMFLPIIVDVDSEENFIGFTNETVWANGFSDEMGKLDHELVLKYQNYNFGGMVIKKDAYLDNGGIKPTIKLTFMYEFFLRMTHLGSVIMVIPKLGYRHTNQREGSLFHSYKDTIDPVEAQWWMSLAKRECHQIKARDIKYEQTEE